MAPHSSTLAWKIPWTEEPSRLQSMRSLRVGHDWATSLSLFTFTHWRRKWQPTPVFLPGESQGRGSLVAAVCGVTQSRTRLSDFIFTSLYSLIHWRLIIHISCFRLGITQIQEEKIVRISRFQAACEKCSLLIIGSLFLDFVRGQS